MEDNRVQIKALSDNRLWQGKRFKSPLYKTYREELLLRLPAKISMPEPPYRLVVSYGLSSPLADTANCNKAFQDALQIKYGFNDVLIIECHSRKELTEKGEEFISFHLEHVDQIDHRKPRERKQYARKHHKYIDGKRIY